MKSNLGTSLYYITHIDNVPSILGRGILSHEQVESQKVQYTPIYDAEIVSSRRSITVPDGRSLWNFANLYFQPRNAMLYRVVHHRGSKTVAIVAVNPEVLTRWDIYLTNGNAASLQSEILKPKEGLKAIRQLSKKVFPMEYWAEEDGSKRKMMAECLVPDFVPPEYIQAIYVGTHSAAEELKANLDGTNLPIIPEPHMFFRPTRQIELTPRLFLAEGDMFFSQMQTLTVSVNCVGVMGKGLASRAKYQFPDVYVGYQDLCRRRTLKIGRPYLYKRESSLNSQMADEAATLPDAATQTWILLFPTKHHWKEQSDIDRIEEGLRWLSANCGKESIQSLAIPALGCGLGRLDWSDVGPIMCKYMNALQIQVVVYLPAEKKIPPEQLTREFLLG